MSPAGGRQKTPFVTLVSAITSGSSSANRDSEIIMQNRQGKVNREKNM